MRLGISPHLTGAQYLLLITFVRSLVIMVKSIIVSPVCGFVSFLLRGNLLVEKSKAFERCI
jgi:hypothetical protein